MGGGHAGPRIHGSSHRRDDWTCRLAGNGRLPRVDAICLMLLLAALALQRFLHLRDDGVIIALRRPVILRQEECRAAATHANGFHVFDPVVPDAGIGCPLGNQLLVGEVPAVVLVFLPRKPVARGKLSDGTVVSNKVWCFAERLPPIRMSYIASLATQPALALLAAGSSACKPSSWRWRDKGRNRAVRGSRC